MEDNKNKNQEELSEEDRIKQENFLLQSKIALKGGVIGGDGTLDPMIENVFLKNIMAFEDAEYLPVFEIIEADLADYPEADALSKKQINQYLKDIITKLENKNILLNLTADVPPKEIYRFLIEDYFFEEVQQISGMDMHIDGCDGDCPSCFQLKYCNEKYETWTDEELEKEIKDRNNDNFSLN